MANGPKNALIPPEMGWVHELAKNELNPEEANIFNATNQFDPKQIIEESTIEFLEELRELFTMHAKVMNSYSESNSRFSEVKIYGISQTPADFMLFRNNVKLVFTNSAHGIISASFIQHNQGQLAIDGAPLNENRMISGARDNQDIIAQLGPFLDVRWTFQSERINPERLVKYYFVEFVKASRVARKDRSSNQLLLKQIKALLQDKGIDL